MGTQRPQSTETEELLLQMKQQEEFLDQSGYNYLHWNRAKISLSLATVKS